MKHLKMCLFAVFAAALLLLPMAASVQAESVATESSIGGVGEQIDILWKYIEDNADKPDDQFYPEFVQKATIAEETISAIYNSIKPDIGADRVGTAVAAIKPDIGAIRSQVEVWRKTAIDQDSYTFELANDDLSVMVDRYNADIDLYNAARYGKRTLNDIGGYVGIPALAFALLCPVLAWALYRNKKSQNAAQEVLRHLRWYIAYATMGLLAATLLPCIVYFLIEGSPSSVLWLPTLGCIAALIVLVVWYARVRIVFKRQQL